LASHWVVMKAVPKWINIVGGIITLPLLIWFMTWVGGILYGPEDSVVSSFEDWFSMEYWMGVFADAFKSGTGNVVVLGFVVALLLYLAIRFKWLKLK
jgi:hypothetical protein